MKFNKWTLGLAALGAVSLASAARADETKLSPLNTAVSNTTISGYVDVAAQWNAGDQSYWSNLPLYAPSGHSGSVRDGFSLNAVDVTLDKSLDESPWASGYHIDLNAGSGAINSDSSFGIRQAYVTMRTPVGNGIDWKMGVMDGVTGYESNTGYLNPNYTRSYGYALNPATLVGLLGSYKVCNEVTVQAGIANRGMSLSNYGQSSYHIESKDFFATVALTAPDSWGWAKGSALNVGTIQGFDNRAVNNYSINASLATPITGLKVGLSYDIIQSLRYSADGNVYGVYASYQATDKLAFHVRGEYVDATDLDFFSGNGKGEEVTATIEYNLWANVVSRAEVRWDHTEIGTQYSRNDTESAYLAAVNLIYKF